LLGHEIHLIVSLDSQRFVVRHPTAAAHGEPIHVGSRVLLHPVAAEVKLFDTNSTHAIPITRHAGTTRPNHGAEAEAGSA
jgi:hypothetical protein